MPGQVWSTGACGCWVAPAGEPLFLGFSEAGFKISVRATWQPVHTDVAALVPHDQSFGGEEAFVIGTLTYWDEAVRQAISARYDPTGGTEGTHRKFDRGGLMITEKLGYGLYLKHPFQALDAFSGLRQGWHFRRAWLQSPDDHEPGTRPYKIHVIFYALGEFDPQNEQFVLYDFNGLEGLKVA